MINKINAKQGKYPEWKESKENIDNFYRFALDEQKVIYDLEKKGFTLVKKQHLSGIKGLKDEVKFLKKPLQKIFDSRNYIGMGISKAISLFSNSFASHSILLVLKK